MSEAACTPRPLAKVMPLSVSVPPSPAPCSPLLLSFSAGPQPFVIEVHARSLRYDAVDALYLIRRSSPALIAR